MTAANGQLEVVLKAAGHSLTKPRRRVFTALLHTEPQAMAALVDVCAPSIDRASVYRTIALFEQLGVVQRLNMGWKYKLELSDQFTRHHHHVTCLMCGRLTDLPEDDQLEARLHKIARQLGFEPLDHQLEMRGYCSACQSRHQ